MLHRHLVKNRASRAFAAMTTMFVISGAVHGGAILFVDDDAPPGGDGTMWNTAYRFLQDALADASGGGVTEVRVGQGTYKPDRDEANPDGTGNREATFQLLNGVALMGGYAGLGAKDPDARDIELFETILSGDLIGNDEPDFVNYEENSYHVTMGTGNDDTALLEGFTITAGNANGVDPNDRGGGFYAYPTNAMIAFCKFEANFSSGDGGGLYSRSGRLDLLHSTIVGNKAGSDSPASGGGMALIYASGWSRVEGCTFAGNSATNIGGGMYYKPGSFITITNCTFENNTVTGPSIAAAGGGGLAVLTQFEQEMVIQDCNFYNNTASSADTYAVAGGLALQGSGIRVVNCDFRGNSANGSLGSLGGAFQVQASSPYFVNCLVAGNSADLGSGLSNILGANATYVDCTITGNTSAKGGGAFYNYGDSEPLLINCILWDNGPQPIIVDEDNAVTTVKYSDVQGGWTGNGGHNIDADPMFVAPGSGDFRLASGSPCVDAGNNWGMHLDYDQAGIFLCELFPVDLDGNPRFNGDETDVDPGCGVPVVVDMGAYEYQFDPADQITFADLNGDGSVGVKDLLFLLGSWGVCGKGCCLADLDINGNVGVTDLLILLGNWGSCP